MKDQTPPPSTVSAQPDVRTDVHSLTPAPPEAPRYRVFLAWTTPDVADRRATLAIMLQKAGMEVFPHEAPPEDETAYRLQVEAMIQKADCSIHLLGGEFGATLGGDAAMSAGRYQYEQARAKSRLTHGSFKRFVWNLPLEGLILQGEQADFVVQVQNSLTSEVLFTSVSNPAQFIDDMRAFLERDITVKAVPKEYDLAFISNTQDAADCYELIERLEKELKVTTLTVVPENDTDYRALAADQIRRSKLAVVYFKESSDWAISFVKQLWKHVGGASSSTPFLLLGEDEPRRNRFLRFKAPQTLLQVVQHEHVHRTLTEVYARVQRDGVLTEETFSPYTGLRPFNEDESIFFKGRERHVDYIIELLGRQKFVMVTGSSGDGKSSLVFAGMIPNLKGGFLKTQFTKWAVADFRPERQPLRNMATALATELRIKNPDDVENALSYGFSALVDLYKKSPIYCDMTSQEWIDADDEGRKAMRRRAANLLILVDQFEEFFTNIENYRDGVASPISQIAVNVLVETVRIAREENLPIYVVCTMRSDYIGQCVAFRGFAEMIGLSTYYVPRLKREEVQEVIQGPAELNGNKVSLRLTQRLLNDLGDGIDQLPVLQHSLHQIWTDADLGAQEMDLLHYARVGGLAESKLPKEDLQAYRQWFAGIGTQKQELYDKPRLRNVLNRHANELYLSAHEYYNARYSPAISADVAQSVIKTAFTCLTKIDENRAVRNRMTLQQITDIHGKEGVDSLLVGRVLNIFREPGNTFLQPYITDDPDSKELTASTTLDITHESFIRNWERLTDWAEAEEKSVTKFRELKVEVNRWVNSDSDKKYLLNAGTYAYFNNWYKEQRPNAAWVRRYMKPDELVAEYEPMEQAALYLEDVEDFLSESRKEITRRRRRRNVALGVILLLFITAIALAIRSEFARAEAQRQESIAVENAKEAQKQASIARIQALEAQNQRLKAERAVFQAQRQTLIAENEKLLAQSERLNAQEQQRIAENERRIAELQKAEALKAKEIAETQTRIANEQRLIAEVKTEEAIIASRNALIQRDNALATQSLFLASLSEQQADKRKYEVATLLALKALPVNLNDSQLSRPYVGEAEAALYYALNRTLNAAPKAEMVGHTNRLIYNAFTPDGQRVVTTSWDKTARIWDVKSGKQLHVLSRHTNIVQQAYVSADGKLVVTFADDFTARVWSIADGEMVGLLRGHDDLLTHAAISPDGQRVVTTAMDKTARLYRSVGGQQIAELTGHTAEVLYASFSSDGRRLVTTSSDGTARLWNGETGAYVATLGGHNGPVRFATFNRSGNLIVTTSDDGTARLWDGLTGALRHMLRGHRDKVSFASFSQDGARVATASADSTVRVWNTATSKEIAELRGHRNAVYHVQFSSDGLHLLTSADDSTTRLWDAVTYLRLSVYDGNPRNGYFASFSPDGKQMAVAGKRNGDYTVRIYDVLPNRQSLIDLGNQRKTRELTPAELKEFFLDDSRLKKELVIETVEERTERLRSKRNQPEGVAKPLPEYELKPDDNAPAPAPAKDNRRGPAPGVAVRPQRHHVVQPNESLWTISEQYGVPVARLKEWNRLTGSNIRPGQKLRIQ